MAQLHARAHAGREALGAVHAAMAARVAQSRGQRLRERVVRRLEDRPRKVGYAHYRDDGRGRPAYEPSLMVASLLYAYARGNRWSRGIERACVEDVA